MRVARRLLVKPFVAALGAVALSTAGFAAVAPGAHAATLPQLTSFHQMVVDTADGYLFFSEGQSSGSAVDSGTFAGLAPAGVVVTTLDGQYVTTLDAGDGVEGLALDGSTLYVALATQDEVAVINATAPTLTQTKAYRFQRASCPTIWRCRAGGSG